MAPGPVPGAITRPTCLENLSHNLVVSRPRTARDYETGESVAVVGYSGVSTTDQNLQLQLDELEEAGAIRIFTYHGVSGSTGLRRQPEACLHHPRDAAEL